MDDNKVIITDELLKKLTPHINYEINCFAFGYRELPYNKIFMIDDYYKSELGVAYLVHLRCLLSFFFEYNKTSPRKKHRADLNGGKDFDIFINDYYDNSDIDIYKSIIENEKEYYLNKQFIDKLLAHISSGRPSYIDNKEQRNKAYVLLSKYLKQAILLLIGNQPKKFQIKDAEKIKEYLSFDDEMIVHKEPINMNSDTKKLSKGSSALCLATTLLSSSNYEQRNW